MIKVLSWELKPVDTSHEKSLQELLRKYSKPGFFYTKENDMIKCTACAHRCKIPPGKTGICKVRYEKDGKLYVPWGYVAGVQADPIEKKPFYHVFPGEIALSWGMLGCDMHCDYCQNWLTSQALRDPLAGTVPLEATPEKIIQLAKKTQSKILISTYNEPLITSEWNLEIFKLGKKHGLYTGYVSNGNLTPEVLEELRPYLDFYKVDLKTFNDNSYRRLGARLDDILNGIRLLKEKNVWVELVTLLVPGFNDSEDELNNMAEFIAELDPNIPWHITAFHPDYKMLDNHRTQPSDLLKAIKIGEQHGLHFIYAGNVPGSLKSYETTYCPVCKTPLIERIGFHVIKNIITKENKCPNCNTTIPGYWNISDNASPQSNASPAT